ncbi:alpha/beta fold hydrolase [Nesterenkonia ebinurensis]|uniref:alpha/beta fold hydrolase n=1 Tax=Nesterenkonia ebinurensis TaxID=2608252 RepID=UPI00123E163B|nr:alpha/beta hydrolase [Nesterenkonia ebinurensis]
MPESTVAPENVTYRVLGEINPPALVIPGGPLLDPEYLNDLGGLASQRALAVPRLPHLRVEELLPTLATLLDTLDLTQADILAHSAGATAAFCALAKWPHKIHRLTLVTPAVSAAGVAPDPDGVAELLARRRQEPGFAEALDAQEQDWLSPAAQRVSFGLWGPEQQRLAQASVHQRQERMQVYYGEPRPDHAVLQAAARSFGGPVTILHGELDVHPTRHQAEELAALFPRGEVVTLPGAGHYPWLDAPDDFVNAVLKSFRR